MDARAQIARRTPPLPGWRTVTASVLLHAAVFGVAAWQKDWPDEPATTEFAQGEQDLVVQLKLVKVETDAGPRLRWTAIPPGDPEPPPEPVDMAEPQTVDVPRRPIDPVARPADPVLPVVDIPPINLRAPRVDPPAEPAPANAPPTPQPDPPPADEPDVAEASPSPPPATPAPRGVNSDAQAVDLPAPQYPRISRRNGETGTVLLEALVAADGSVKRVTVIKSPGFKRLEAAASDALRRATFRPAMRNGRAIESRVRVPFVFALER